jgi:sporulation protein YlmC with PRC-barrel domain
MFRPLLTLAIVTAMGLTAAQAQTPPARDSAHPSIATLTAPGGADARKLIGRNVKNAQNEIIGEIKSIHLDQSGKVDGILVGVGGFLGVGEREVLLAWRDLQIDANGEVVRANMTKDQLKAMSGYTYKDPAYRGTVFTDNGVWQADRTDTASNATVPTRSTGDFNVAGQMSSSALVGKTVKNATNENVGTIQDIYLDNTGAVKLVVVSVGGFLGMGAKDVGVPWSDLKFGRDGSSITVMTNWTKDSLKAMPDYKDERRMPTGTVRSGG